MQAAFLSAILYNFFGYLLFYFLFAGMLYYLCWMRFAGNLKNRRIQVKRRTFAPQIRHDVLFSLQSIFLSSILLSFLFAAHELGYTRIYHADSNHSLGYTLFSLILVLVIDDAFFYWSHRLMHHRRLFRLFHKEHHHSTDPSPFTSLAFQPLETLVENVVGMALPFVLPIHWNVILIWQTISFANNFLAHLGYEFYPHYWLKVPLLRLKTTSTHHNMHHRLFNGNYGLYFTIWDKLMGTEFPNYAETFSELHSRRRED